MKRALFNLFTLLLSLIGMGVAGFLSYKHFHPELSAGCSTGPAACGTVLSSTYSKMGPIPTAFLGLGMYLTFLLLALKRKSLIGQMQASPQEEEDTTPHPNLATLHRLDGAAFLLALIGVSTSYWLQGKALFEIVAFCNWCFTSAILVTLLFLLSIRDFFFEGRKIEGEQKLVVGVVGFVLAMVAFINVPLVYAQYIRIKKEQAGATPPTTVKLNRNLLLKPEMYIKGPANAKLLIIGFADMQCQSCKEAHDPFEQIPEHYPGKVAIAFRHYPLAKHKWARDAATAVEAAGIQGKFWEMQKVIFANQYMFDELDFDPNTFVTMATSLGIDGEKFAEDMGKEATRKRVQGDLQSGFDSGIQNTPSFFAVTSNDIWRFRGMDTLFQALMNTKHPMWRGKEPVLTPNMKPRTS
jgi:protein-disulfide isomerase/uncharacterized membrane protein